MFDVHIHAKAGWTEDIVARSLEMCGFEKALLLAALPDHWGVELNEGCARMIRRFPDKLVGLVGVYPPDVEGSLRAIETYGRQGFIGVKLMPTVGYYPDDERHRRVFEEVNARGWIVLMHCGFCAPGVREPDLPQSTRFSDPYHIEPLARIFPQTDFILAHGGGRTYFPRAWELTHYLKNVYIDTCRGQGPWALRHGGEWFEVLNWDNVLFGTDTELGNLRHAQIYADEVRQLEDVLRQGGFADRINAVLRDNPRRLLRKHGVAV